MHKASAVYTVPVKKNQEEAVAVASCGDIAVKLPRFLYFYVLWRRDKLILTNFC